MKDALEYTCSNGHQSWAPEGHNLKKCPHVVKGLPCLGELRRTGAGSKKANQPQEKQEA